MHSIKAARNLFVFHVLSLYLEGVGLDPFGFEPVVVGVEGGEFAGQHGQLDKLVLSQI